MNSTKAIGNMGEEAAADWLSKNGAVILKRNFRAGRGEIDIVAKKGAELLFIEVKTRGENSLGRPCEAVSREKRRRLVNAAQCYLLNGAADLQPRFDVVEVFLNAAGRVLQINSIENAFTLDDI